MRILKKDFKHGNIRVQIEDVDDLWYLSGIIEPGDAVRASTERKIKLGGSDEKARVIKKRCTLTIRVEKTDYTGGELRTIGPITDGPDDIPRGSSHSFTLNEGDEISITKDPWPSYMREKLDEASKPRGLVIVCLYDREQAIILKVTSRSVSEILTLKGDVAKKGLDDQKQGHFYKDLANQLEELLSRHSPKGIVLASPAFWQEYLKKQISPAIAKKAVFTTISDVERTAVKELLKRPEVQSLLADARSTQELGFVDEIMTGLAQDKVAYGDTDVIAAVKEGNVKALFVTEKHIRDLREDDAFEPLDRTLKTADQLNAAVHIISTDEAEDKIEGLGGSAALKRW